MKSIALVTRRQKQYTLERVKRLQDRYGISDADIDKPGFYSFDHVTGAPFTQERANKDK